jgi:PA domain
MTTKTVLRTLLGIAAAVVCSIASASATFTIVNGNGPGVGFNDPTAAAPVGGNTGTTLGQQRLNAFQYAASLWGAKLDSAPTISVLAGFLPLSCTATTAVLGSAGPTEIWSDFSGAPLAGTWYHYSLADKLAGSVLDPAAAPQILARFNSNLGNAGCLTGMPFYLGLDSNPPAGQIDLVVVLLHEFGHGLGFSTVTDASTGMYFNGPPALPSAFDHFLFDNTLGLSWVDMTDAQRQASAINVRNLVWAGTNVTTAVPSVLAPGVPKLTVIEPLSIAGDYQVGTASFGPVFNTVDLTRQVMPIIDAGNLSLACAPFDATNQRFAKNRIAVVQRGTCGFVVKVKNAQDAGAVGVIVIDNVAGSPPAGMSGTDPTISIPSVRVSQADGITLLNGMDFNISSGRSVNEKVHLFSDFSQLSGADETGHALMYTPNPFQPGSSVSHWDTIAFPNLLMEPAINPGLTQSVEPPQDLTLPLLKDLGW